LLLVKPADKKLIFAIFFTRYTAGCKPVQNKKQQLFQESATSFPAFHIKQFNVV